MWEKHVTEVDVSRCLLEHVCVCVCAARPQELGGLYLLSAGREREKAFVTTKKVTNGRKEGCQ